DRARGAVHVLRPLVRALAEGAPRERDDVPPRVANGERHPSMEEVVGAAVALGEHARPLRLVGGHALALEEAAQPVVARAAEAEREQLHPLGGHLARVGEVRARAAADVAAQLVAEPRLREREDLQEALALPSTTLLL